MTVTPQTVLYMTEGVRYLSSRGFQSIAVFHVEEVAWNAEDFRACEEQFYMIGELYTEALEKDSPLTIAPLRGRIASILSGNADSLEESSCGAGRSYIGIGVDGTIFPCHRFVSSHGFRGAFPLGSIESGFPAGQVQRRVPGVKL